jgi:hypothetical protein
MVPDLAGRRTTTFVLGGMRGCSPNEPVQPDHDPSSALMNTVYIPAINLVSYVPLRAYFIGTDGYRDASRFVVALGDNGIGAGGPFFVQGRCRAYVEKVVAAPVVACIGLYSLAELKPRESGRLDRVRGGRRGRRWWGG